MEYNTPGTFPKTPAKSDTFPRLPSDTITQSPAHPYGFPVMSQSSQTYSTPQRHVQAPVNVYRYAIPLPTPNSSSQMSPEHAAAHLQVNNSNHQHIHSLVMQESVVPSLLDFAGAPVPLMPSTSSALHSEAAPSLQQHPNGVYCIDKEGHRTSPRRAGKHSKPLPEKEKVLPKASKAAKAAKAAKSQVSKPKGKGSRSGKNARTVGASDDEIAELTDKDKEAAQLVVPEPRRRWSDEEKVIIVDYMVSPENWARAPLNMKELCLELSQVKFKSQRTVEQVHQCWLGIWKLYKLAVRRQKHTGGGDGDEQGFPLGDPDDLDESANTTLLSGDEDGEDEGEEDEGKRKKTTEDTKNSKNKRQPSLRSIDAFAKSNLFEKIDAVASGRPDVMRKNVYSSHRTTEDIDNEIEAKEEGGKSQKRKRSESSDMDELLAVAIKGLGERREETAHIDKKRLVIEEERFSLEQQKLIESARRDEARLEIERERNKREADEAKQKRLFDMLSKYHELKASDDGLDKALAKKLAKEIAAAEGLDFD